MFRPALTGFALVLVASLAQAAPPTNAASTQLKPNLTPDHPPVPAPAWVRKSNADAMTLMNVLAQFSPEFASRFGLPGYDTKVVDLKPNVDQRTMAALTQARDTLQQDLAGEKDPNVRQDLEIMIKAADRQIERIKLDDQYLLDYNDVGEIIFQGEFGLLQDDVPAERRAHAVDRDRKSTRLNSVTC